VSGSLIEVVAELPEQFDCYGASAFDVAAFDIPNELTYFTGGPDCRTLYRYDMESDVTAEVAHIPDSSVQSPSLAGMTLSPDGRYLALEEHPGPRRNTFRVMLADLQAEQVGFVEGVYQDSLHGSSSFWLANDRYLLTGPAKQQQALVVDPQLNTVATIDELPGGPGGIHGETVYVVSFGSRLVSAPAAGGAARELRTFLDPEVRAFLVLPRGETFDPSATGANNVAATPTAQPPADPQETDNTATDDARDAGDSRDAGAFTTGRMVGAGIVVFVASAAGVLLAVSRRRSQGSGA
jgi:hypothetical protein